MLGSKIGIPEHFRLKKQRIGGIDPVLSSKVILKVDILYQSFFCAKLGRKRINPGNTCLHCRQGHIYLLGIGVLGMRGNHIEIDLWLALEGLGI